MIRGPGNVTGKGKVDELSSKMKQGFGGAYQLYATT